METQSKTEHRLGAFERDACPRYSTWRRLRVLAGMTLSFALVVPFAPTSVAWADGEPPEEKATAAEEIQLDYKGLPSRSAADRGAADRSPRDKSAREPAAAERPRGAGGKASSPAPRGLPSKVLIQVPENLESEPEASKRHDPRAGEKPYTRDSEAADRRSRAGDRRLEYGHLDRMADQAGHRAAEARMAREGRREYFRLGFHEGLHAAFDDRRFARWYYRDGVDAGQRDPEALSSGHRLGRDEAEHLARERSENQVVAQFTDLRREPRRRPDDRPPASHYALPRVAQPVLHHVFEQRPWYGHGYGDDWRGSWLDPWTLYSHDDWGHFYHDDWADPGDALRDWRRSHRDRWRSWSETERRRFEHRFRYAFRHRLARLSHKADRYYRDGVSAGWNHGLDLVADWQFRRGYGEGYEQALQRAAGRAFDTTYSSVYRRHYGDLFDDWARNPKPAVLGATLYDGDRDGVFEPGESLWARFAVANYGGAAAQVQVMAKGYPLLGRGESSLWLRRRSREEAEAIELRIDPRAEVRSQGELTLALADGYGTPVAEPQKLTFRIAHALELGQRFELLAHDSLAGRATVAMEVINGSRRRASGRLVLFAGGRTYGGDRLHAVDPGERWRERFELHGLHPLDVLAGSVPLRAELHGDTPRRDGVLDTFEGRLPDLLGQRQDHGLGAYLIEVALGQRRATRGEIERAQKLMLERLRHDWHRAVAADGNPYRRDIRGGGETALGELVREVERYRERLRNAYVFESLVPRIEALADSLPGAHPFLRRSMKNLARQMRG